MVTDALVFVFSPLINLLQPYFQWLYSFLTASKTHRFALKSLLFSILFFFSFSSAITLYSFFYKMYMPNVHTTVPLQFILLPNTSFPTAYHVFHTFQPIQSGITTTLIPHTQSQPNQPPITTTSSSSSFSLLSALPFSLPYLASSFLTPNQPYDLSIELTAPTSPHNRNLGPFLVQTILFANQDVPLYHKLTTFQFPYQSPSITSFYSLLHFLPTLVGVRKESVTFHLNVFQDIYSPFQFTSSYGQMYAHWLAWTSSSSLLHSPFPIPSPPFSSSSSPSISSSSLQLTHMVVKISSPIQLDQAQVHIHAQLHHGLTYWMYYWFFSSAIIGIVICMIWPTFLGGLIWWMCQYYGITFTSSFIVSTTTPTPTTTSSTSTTPSTPTSSTETDPLSPSPASSNPSSSPTTTTPPPSPLSPSSSSSSSILSSSTLPPPSFSSSSIVSLSSKKDDSATVKEVNSNLVHSPSFSLSHAKEEMNVTSEPTGSLADPFIDVLAMQKVHLTSEECSLYDVNTKNQHENEMESVLSFKDATSSLSSTTTSSSPSSFNPIALPDSTNSPHSNASILSPLCLSPDSSSTIIKEKDSMGLPIVNTLLNSIDLNFDSTCSNFLNCVNSNSTLDESPGLTTTNAITENEVMTMDSKTHDFIRQGSDAHELEDQDQGHESLSTSFHFITPSLLPKKQEIFIDTPSNKDDLPLLFEFESIHPDRLSDSELDRVDKKKESKELPKETLVPSPTMLLDLEEYVTLEKDDVSMVSSSSFLSFHPESSSPMSFPIQSM